MEDIDDDWDSFIQNEYADVSNSKLSNIVDFKSEDSTNTRLSIEPNILPKCSDIYISTKTKISYLNKSDIDIKNIFWNIPVISYSIPSNGVIKKQIKYSSTSKEEVEYIANKLKLVKCYEEQIIEHIDNPDGRIKYKDQRKISIGICKKDILSYRSKKKRAFFNCFVLIMRLLDNGEYKEMHIKVFNTGKLEIPGIQSDLLLTNVLTLLVNTLKPFLGEDLAYLSERSETVLINSNFNCGYYIDRDKLHDLLKYKYRINSNFDACSYPGIQCKFYYDNTLAINKQMGHQPTHKNYHEISFMIFRTGSVLIVGKCDDNILFNIYDFLKNILETEYLNIAGPSIDLLPTNKNRIPKIRRKILLFD